MKGGDHSNGATKKHKKGLWSPEEDEKLVNYMLTNGQGCWSDVARNAGLQRCGKSCRLRWINYLRPDLKRGAFSPQEEEIIVHLHSILGNRKYSNCLHHQGFKRGEGFPDEMDNDETSYDESYEDEEMCNFDVMSNDVEQVIPNNIKGIGSVKQ
ncbi:hypothetical protein F3Y22_tig00111708pilonHSYRG00369 [Hibiscus syriacus]|uniref:Transcription factor MYB46 n=1 Tax=Hibiscus syriacus TaxID=106335 RepID=A0A6A2XXP0_HIBSY|nr:hypothetical protein F3Y22_tig00111708pilonHSYRG00369 [Hibiscus syriacus]